MGDPITAAANSVQHITNYWQVISLVVVGVFGVFGLWIWRRTETKTKENAELIKAKDEAQNLATQMRKAERDAQFDALKKDITNAERTAKGIGESLDRHVEFHRAADMKIEKMFGDFNNALRDMAKDVVDVKVAVGKIEARMEERDQKRKDSI